MAKKMNPYYHSEEEKKELIEGIKNFSFDSTPLSGLTIVLVGKEGAGKTHMAMTMKELGPVYVIDTERRAKIVGTKLGVANIKQVTNYKEVITAVKAILRMPKGTIVIDSGSDLQTYAEAEYLARTKAEKIYPIFNWTEVWGMLNAILDDIKDADFNCVLTAKVKDEYVNDRVVGKVPRIYKDMPYRADLIIVKNGKQWTVEEEFNGKNGFSRKTLAIDENSLPRTIENALKYEDAEEQEKSPETPTKLKRF